MQENLVYQGNSVNINVPVERDVVVYSHPADVLNFTFDISGLRKEIVNGDLVIHFLNGRKITIANYAIMFVTEDTPEITDILGKTYAFDDVLNDTLAKVSNDDLSKVIINRRQSSASTDLEGSTYLAHADISESSEYDGERFSGQVNVEEQAPLLSTSVENLPYQILSLGQPTALKNATDITFSYAGKTLQNREEEGTLPTPVQITKLTIEALYGAKYDVDSSSSMGRDLSVSFYNGGGEKIGTTGFPDIGGLPAVEYQYLREKHDFSANNQSIQYNGSTSDKIQRKVRMTARGTNITVQEVRISGVPDGVTIQSTDKYTAKPVGKGTYVLEAKTQTPYLDVLIEYDTSLPAGSFELAVSMQSYNYKYQTLVFSDDSMVWDFKPITSVNDIENYNGVNTFSFSTNIDKLEIITGNMNDYVIAGVGDHIYRTLAGDDIFISGEGNDTVYLGSGEDIFVLGNGINTADAEQGNATLSWGGGDVAKSPYSAKDSTITIGNNQVTVSYQGNTTVATGFSYLELDRDDVVLNIDNTNNINLTVYLSEEGTQTGEGIVYVNSAVDIYVGENYLTTNNGSGRVIYNVDKDGRYSKNIEKFYGSNQNDNIYASNAYNIVFDGRGGNDTVNYESSGVTSIVFNLGGDGKVTGGTGEDIYTNINKIIGTAGYDTFYAGYGVASGAMEYWGYTSKTSAPSSGQTGDTVSYENSTTGISVDYFAGTDDYVNVTRGSVVDKLWYIDTIAASSKNDTFIMGSSQKNIDGKGGYDAVDYSNLTQSNIVFNIDSLSTNGFKGSISKNSSGASGDTYDNINKFIGTKGALGNTFNVNIAEYKGEGYYIGAVNSTADAINYSKATNVSILVNWSSTGQMSIDINSSDGTSKLGTDTLENIDSMVLTNNNDTFVLSKKTDVSAIISIDGGTNSTLNEGTRTSTGDIFQLGEALTANDDILTALSARIKNFESLKLKNDVDNTLIYNPTINPLFKHIYGGSKVDSFDGSLSSTAISFDINKKDIKAVNQDGNTLYLFDFDKFVGGNANDTFNISADISISLDLNGGGGQNTLSYSGIKTAITDVNLVFDLAKKTVTKEGSSFVDKFDNIQSVIGGDGDDKFILDSAKFYQINGGEGHNTVSFQNYNTAINPSTISSDRYVNIQEFELTRFGDAISISYDDTTSYTFNGGGEKNSENDTYSIEDANGGDVEYNIGVTTAGVAGGNYVIVNRGAGKDTLSSFEILNGGNGNNVYNINSYSNSNITSSGILYILNTVTSGKTNTANYDSITSSVTLTVGATDGKTNTAYNKIEKASGSVDYLENMDNINLGNSSSGNILKILNAAATMHKAVIDLGGGSNDTIDVSGGYSNTTITIDQGGKFSYGGVELTIKNWEKIIGGNGSEVFIFENIDHTYESVSGGAGEDTIDISESSGDVSLNFLTPTNSQYKLNVGSYSISFKEIEILQFNAQSKINIVGSLANSYRLVGSENHTGSGNGSTLDYSQVTINGSQGFTFSLSTDSNGQIIGTEVIKDAINRAIDNLQGDFIDTYIGTAKNDNFIVSVPNRLITLDGGEGKNTLMLNLGQRAINDLTYDLVANQVQADGAVILNIKNMSVLQGADGAGVVNTFKIDDSSSAMFVNQGSISGAGQLTVFDATAMTKGISVDLAASRFLLKEGGVGSTTKYISYSNVNEIYLGSGDDTLIYANMQNSSITKVDGGDGTNSFSFQNERTAMNVTLGKITGGSTGTIDLINFDSYELTSYNDTVLADEASLSTSYTVNGGGGTNTIDYSGISSIGISVSLDSKTTATITKGSQKDTALFFNVLKLSQKDSTVTSHVSDLGYTIYGYTGVNNAIDYSNLSGNLVIDLGRESSSSLDVASITKLSGSGSSTITIDKLYNFNTLTGTNGVDTVLLNKDYMIGSVTTINLGQGQSGSADVLTATNSTVSTTYEELSGGDIKITLGSKEYTITGGSGLNIGGYTGSNTQKNIFNVLGNQKNVIYTGSVTNLEDELNYTTSENLTFDFKANTVTSNGGIKNSFKSIDKFKGGVGNDSFVNLNDFNSYNVDGGGTESNTISYDNAYTALKFTVDNSGNVVVEKRSGLVSDTIKNINTYKGSSLADTFVLDLGFSNLSQYNFDGSLGNDIIEFKGNTGALNIIYDESAGSTVNGTVINIRSIEIFNLTDEGDTFTLTGSLPNSLTVDGKGGNNNFVVNASVSGSVVLSYNFADSNKLANLQGGSSSLNLSNFNNFELNSTNSNIVNLRDFKSDGATLTISNAKELNLYNYGILGTINIDANKVTMANATNANFTGVNRLNLLSTSASSQTVNLNINGSALNMAIDIGASHSTVIKLSSSLFASSNEINVAFNSSISASELKISGTGAIQSRFLNQATLDLTDISKATTLNFGSSSSNKGFNIYKEVKATQGNNISVSFANYNSNLSNIELNNNTLTLNANSSATQSKFSNISKYTFNNLDNNITIGALPSDRADVNIKKGTNGLYTGSTTSDANTSILNGSSGSDTLVWNAELHANNPKNVGTIITIDGKFVAFNSSLESDPLLGGFRPSGWYQLEVSNFENIDFSKYNGENYGIRIEMGGTTNRWSTVIAPRGKANNILDFSNSGANVTGVNLVINIMGRATSDAVAWMSASGSYTASGSSNFLTQAENFKQILGSSGRDTLKFGYMNFSDLTEFARNVVAKKIGGGSGATDHRDALYIDGGDGGDTIDFSSWDLTQDITSGAWASIGFNMKKSTGGGNPNIWVIGTQNESYPQNSPNYQNFYQALSIRYYESDNIVLPKGVVYIEEVLPTTFTISAPVNNLTNSYVIFSGLGLRGKVSNYSKTFDLFSDSKGTSKFHLSAGGDQTLIGVEAISLYASSENGGVTPTVNIGASGTDGLFMSSKVKVTAHAFFSSGSSNYNSANYDFSNIDSGSYYFTFETFDNPRDFALGMGDPNNYNLSGRTIDESYYNTMKTSLADPHSMVTGIGFTTFSQKDLIEGDDRESNMSLMYAVEGVNNLTLTGSDDTFSLGKGYVYVSGSTDYWVSPILASWGFSSSARTPLFKPGTTNSSVNGGEGLDTFYDEFFTADFKYQTAGNAGDRMLLNADWKYDGTTITAAANSTKLSADTASSTYAITSQSGGYTIGGLYSAINLTDFDSLIIDDYDTDHSYARTGVGKSANNDLDGKAFFGKDDDIVINHSSSSSGLFTVDLGGRYMNPNIKEGNLAYQNDGNHFNGIIDETKVAESISDNVGKEHGEYYIQTAEINASGYSGSVNFTWVSDFSSYVDTSMYIAMGSGKNYSLKNFDTFVLSNYEGSQNTTMSFRTNINFDSLSGHILRLVGLEDITFYDGYNYEVERLSGYTKEEIVILHEIDAYGEQTGRNLTFNFSLQKSDGGYTNQGITIKTDSTGSPASSGVTYALYNYTQDLDNSTWNYGNSDTEGTTDTNIDDIIAKQDDSNSNSTDSVAKSSFAYNQDEDFSQAEWIDNTSSSQDKDSSSLIKDSLVNENQNQTANDTNNSSKEELVNLWQGENEDIGYGNSDTDQSPQENQEDLQSLGQDKPSQDQGEDGEGSKEDEESTANNGEGSSNSNEDSPVNLWSDGSSQGDSSYGNSDTNNANTKNSGTIENEINYNGFINNVEESLDELHNLDFSQLSSSNEDNANISDSSGIMDAISTITEDSVIQTQRADETDSMSFALEEGVSIADDSSNTVAIDVNKQKHISNSGFSGN